MKNPRRLPQIKSFNSAKKAAQKDIKTSGELNPRQITADEVLYELINVKEVEEVKVSFDNNVISEREIINFRKLART